MIGITHSRFIPSSDSEVFNSTEFSFVAPLTLCPFNSKPLGTKSGKLTFFNGESELFSNIIRTS